MFIILFIINTTLFSQDITCSNIPLSLILQKNTIYTYNNSMSIATWPKGQENETHIKREIGNFESKLIPVDYNFSEGFSVYEVNTKSDNSYILKLLGKAAENLPIEYIYPSKTIGILENSVNKQPTTIKHVKCGTVYRTTSEQSLSDLGVNIKKTNINKIISIEMKKVPVINILTKSEIVLSGKMIGTGSETTTTSYILKTRELYEKKTTFKYEYNIGRGKDRHTEIMSGDYIKKTISKEKYKVQKTIFPNQTLLKNQTRFYTNNSGLFVPVTINTTLKTKMYINTNSTLSFIYYPFYYQNFTKDQENYFFPINSLDIAGNTCLYPSIKIMPDSYDDRINFKIPGIIGNDILSLGTLYINEKKRTFSFYEPIDNKKISPPENSIIFKLIDNNIVFPTTVNSTNVNTTISFSTYEPEISTTLQEKLNLKTRQFTLSQKNPENKIVQKAKIIFTPPDEPFSNKEVIIRDFRDAPYDLKLGLNFIKNREITINYKERWLLIKKTH